MNFYQYTTSGNSKLVHKQITYDVNWNASVLMQQWWEFDRMNFSCKLTGKDFFYLEFLNPETDECASKELFDELIKEWESKDFSDEELSIEKDAREEGL